MKGIDCVMHRPDDSPVSPHRFRSVKVLAVCLAISFLMVVLKPGDVSWLSTPRSDLDTTMAELTGRVGWIARVILLAGQSRSLHSKVADDPLILESMKDLRAQNQRLRGLLGFSQNSGPRILVAEVVGKETGRLGAVILINQGSATGVSEGWIAFSPEGLVGKVSKVKERFSRVQLITNYNSPVSVRIERSGVEAVVEWKPSLPSKLALRFIQPGADVSVGDVVVSSGLGGVYPAGLKVGTVSKVQIRKEQEEPFVEVRPSVDFSRLVEVLLAPPEAIKVEMQATELFNPEID